MSINLTLVFDHFCLSGPLLAYERLRLDWQDYEAFDRIKAEAVPLPEGVQWYEDDGIEHRAEDPYGEPLKFMAAHTLARHLSALPLRGWDVAVLTFVKSLRPDTRVVLWWS
jgi:hypothetical protein